VTDPNTAWDFDYRAATGMLPADFPFTALIMAAILRGDSANRRKIMCAFPAVAADLTAPGAPIDEAGGAELDATEIVGALVQSNTTTY